MQLGTKEKPARVTRDSVLRPRHLWIQFRPEDREMLQRIERDELARIGSIWKNSNVKDDNVKVRLPTGYDTMKDLTGCQVATHLKPGQFFRVHGSTGVEFEVDRILVVRRPWYWWCL
jgi:hypothetical protein